MHAASHESISIFLLDAIFQNSINRHLNNQIGTAVVVICTILVHAVLFGL